jgi:hypothetical protein
VVAWRPQAREKRAEHDHPSFQQIAFFVEETGEHGERQLLLDRMNPTIEELPAAAAARAIAFAIEQPADTDVNKIIIRPTAQGC